MYSKKKINYLKLFEQYVSHVKQTNLKSLTMDCANQFKIDYSSVKLNKVILKNNNNIYLQYRMNGTEAEILVTYLKQK